MSSVDSAVAWSHRSTGEYTVGFMKLAGDYVLWRGLLARVGVFAAPNFLFETGPAGLEPAPLFLLRPHSGFPQASHGT